ncbi:hypothetical protein E4U54_003024 [Claviceps lovelessii]|nr:hypothetical protein E4U54_003024 [Claviceps lovelessii]
MYGLPGDPNSSRLNRNAAETRVHSLWNHLIETASSHTGSLLIWDTGTYAVLPRRSKHAPRADPASQESSSSSSTSPSSQRHQSQQVLLARAFSSRHIRIRLHGSKLPPNYVLNLRLTRTEDQQRRAKNATGPARKRGRRRGEQERTARDDSSDAHDDDDDDDDDEKDLVPAQGDDSGRISPTQKELRELEDAEVTRTNAYPGATNSIGSIHQRKWYLSLDRPASGFAPRRAKNGKLNRKSAADGDPDADSDAHHADVFRQGHSGGMRRLSYPFYVRGVGSERSVVTGRRGDDVLRDEGVEGFVRRKGWKPVLN